MKQYRLESHSVIFTVKKIMKFLPIVFNNWQDYVSRDFRSYERPTNPLVLVIYTHNTTVPTRHESITLDIGSFMLTFLCVSIQKQNVCKNMSERRNNS